jgi:glucosamine-6-phosphate deaminase
MTTMPAYLNVSAAQLGQGTPVRVEIVGDMAAAAEHLAHSMFAQIKEAQERGHAATMIIPVGPVDQFPILAGLINDQQLDCRDVMLINMDEYLTDDDQWLDIEHPLSFRRYMNDKFYDLLESTLAPKVENRVFPDPAMPERISELIETRGGVDVCYGGIGINGHIAFNEPPEPGETVSNEAFSERPTRALSLARETRAINSNTVGGELSIIPHRAVTVGMKEILAARQLRFYCNRPWQSAVVRRVLHGPISAACPASFLRSHADAALFVADYVADLPDIRLR